MRTLPVTLILLATLALGAQDHAGNYADADIAAGARLYAAVCVSCHGPSGTGVGTVDLRRGPLPRASTDAALAGIISNGIPGTGMPGFALRPEDLRGIVAFIRSGLPEATDAALATGSAERGRSVFEGRGACLECHRVQDKGSYAGPDLSDIGRTRTAASIQQSLVNPSLVMRPINRPVRAVTRDGHIVNGRRLNEDTYTVQLITDQGRLVSFMKDELSELTVSTVSTMPSYRETLTPDEQSDVVAYLISLKGAGQ
jgi:putative heme-binding domain-containing protein